MARIRQQAKRRQRRELTGSLAHPARANTCGGEPSTAADMDSIPLACPVQRRYDGQLPLSDACVEGIKGCRRVKDHLKTFHLCDCPAVDALVVCAVPGHISEALLNEIYKMKRRSAGAPEGEQWKKIYGMLHAEETNIPAAYLPRGEQLVAIAQDPPEGFVEALEAELERAVGNIGRQYSRAGLFLSQLPVFYDLVCREGTVSRPRAPVSVVAEGQATGARSTEVSASIRRGVAAPVQKNWGDDLVNWEG